MVEDEGLLDAVTAVSGGGPALCIPPHRMPGRGGRGRRACLPDLAMRLARVTVYRAPANWRASSLGAGVRPAPERHSPAPPARRSEALKILMAADGWQPLMTRKRPGGGDAPALRRTGRLGRRHARRSGTSAERVRQALPRPGPHVPDIKEFSETTRTCRGGCRRHRLHRGPDREIGGLPRRRHEPGGCR